jgi:AraC family transcriptional regulator, transcriptional activator of pobA
MKGAGKHFIDDSQYDILPPQVFILKKDQIHAWDITDTPEGYVLIIKDAFIANVKDTELKALFHLFWATECLALGENANIVIVCFKLLHQESLEQQRFSQEVIEGLIKVILGKLLQHTSRKTDSKYIDTYTRFLNLIATSKTEDRSIAGYAKELNMSVPAINNICKKIGGKPAKKLVDEYTLAEAKRHLEFSTLTISEIAFHLRFNDPSYFVKFFKHHQGVTPSAYRDSLH